MGASVLPKQLPPGSQLLCPAFSAGARGQRASEVPGGARQPALAGPGCPPPRHLALGQHPWPLEMRVPHVGDQARPWQREAQMWGARSLLPWRVGSSQRVSPGRENRVSRCWIGLRGLGPDAEAGEPREEGGPQPSSSRVLITELWGHGSPSSSTCAAWTGLRPLGLSAPGPDHQRGGGHWR